MFLGGVEIAFVLAVVVRDTDALAAVLMHGHRSPPQDKGTTDIGACPSHVHRYLGVLNLPTMSLGVVVAMFSVPPVGTIIVGHAPELPYVLDHHAYSVGVTLTQMAPASVVRPLSPKVDSSVGNVVFPLSFFAETGLKWTLSSGQR